MTEREMNKLKTKEIIKTLKYAIRLVKNNSTACVHLHDLFGSNDHVIINSYNLKMTEDGIKKLKKYILNVP